MTGDPHTDARLEAWRPADRRTPLPDQLPAPDRERHVRIVGITLALLIAMMAGAYIALAVLGSGAVSGR